MRIKKSFVIADIRTAIIIIAIIIFVIRKIIKLRLTNYRHFLT